MKRKLKFIEPDFILFRVEAPLQSLTSLLNRIKNRPEDERPEPEVLKQMKGRKEALKNTSKQMRGHAEAEWAKFN